MALAGALVLCSSMDERQIMRYRLFLRSLARNAQEIADSFNVEGEELRQARWQLDANLLGEIELFIASLPESVIHDRRTDGA